MTRKIAILRGINVGGKRKILMTDLKAMFEGMKFTEIKTYIQSGNVIFDAPDETNNPELSLRIEKSIKQKFGFDVPVIIRSAGELNESINRNPFYHEKADINNLHLTLLSDEPSNENKQQIGSSNFEPDKFIIDGKDVFIYCEGMYHKSKLTNNFFENKLKVKATTRNWKTVLKLADISR
ncbi:MAG: DUF1697 domain-containing protein [Bacteroidales bacterium]|nr:DUF1697 domain-containing protein [Bacteroidales bacterium]MCF8404387.1 DUF1697 domain-containing protein [Bacteroidales bacterium]